MIIRLGYAVVAEKVHYIARWKIPSGQGLDVKSLVRNHMPKLQREGNTNKHERQNQGILYSRPSTV